MATQETDALNPEETQQETQTVESEQVNSDESDEIVDPREQIAAERQELVDQEIGVSDEPEEQEQAEVQAQEGVDEQLEAAGISSIDPNAKFMMKLDGEEQEITGQELIAGFQKNTVASRRMNEATAKLKEADQILANAKAQADTSTTESSDEDKPEVLDKAKDVVDQILDSDEDAAVEYVKELLDGNNKKPTQEQEPVNTQEIASQVKQQLDYDSALTQFETDYADVITDPNLADMTNRNLATEIQSGQHATIESALKAAGDATRNWMQDMGLGQKTEETTTQNSKVANKQALEAVPGVTASAANEVEAEESASDVIAEMEKQRGYGT